MAAGRQPDGMVPGALVTCGRELAPGRLSVEGHRVLDHGAARSSSPNRHSVARQCGLLVGHVKRSTGRRAHLSPSPAGLSRWREPRARRVPIFRRWSTTPDLPFRPARRRGHRSGGGCRGATTLQQAATKDRVESPAPVATPPVPHRDIGNGECAGALHAPQRRQHLCIEVRRRVHRGPSQPRAHRRAPIASASQ